MTKQSTNDETTEFSRWLRKHEKLDSGDGFITTDLDYIWENYKSGKWMILEEKRFLKKCVFPQTKQWEELDKKIREGDDEKYYGFHLITFEITHPDDGNIFLDYKKITKKDLIEFLRFEKAGLWYKSLKINSYSGGKDYDPRPYVNEDD